MPNVTYIREDDLIARQAEAEKRMLQEFDEGNYTFGSPLIKINPYIICPCAAVVLFKTEKEAAVTVTVRGKLPAADIRHTFPKAKVHILPVLGLYPGYENTVDLELYQGDKNTVKIATEALPNGAAEMIQMTAAAEYLQGDLIFVSPAGEPDRLTGFDFRGDVRWYAGILLQMGMKRLQNGRFLVGTNRVIASPYYTSGLYEMDLVGKIYVEYLIPGGYHHDQFEMPDGDLLVLTEDRNRDTVEDMCVLVDRDTGAVKKTWDYTHVITPGDSSSGLATQEDWFHNNAVWYDEKTNSLSLSGRHVDAIVNLDYDTGAIRWILGDPEGWSVEKQKYFFTPAEGKEFAWQYAQHAVSVLPCGDILCFDNGTNRSKNKEKYVPNKDNYSRAVRYRIHTENRTIEQVWEYGRELGGAFFSQFISNAECYGEDHYLIHSGGIQLYDGVPSDKPVTGSDDPRARRESATICLMNGVKVLDMRIRGNYYRAKRLSLYHDGRLAVTKSEELPAAAAAGEALPPSCQAHIVEHGGYFFLKARFQPEQQVFVVLERDGQVSGYRVKTGDRFARINCRPYLEADENNTSTLLSKNGLNGQYDVKVIIDGKIYETGVRITC